jgi:hypothetical protein
MNIITIDSNLFKTADQAGVSEEENIRIARKFIQEAIDEHFKLIMVQMLSLLQRNDYKSKFSSGNWNRN